MTARRPAAKPTRTRKVKAARKRDARSPGVASHPDSSGSRTDPAVDEFMRTLDHPLKAELESLRQLIRDASPEIREGFKWNSPSFRTSDYFATINIHGKSNLRLILHTGAKVKASATKGLEIADPSGLLKWLAKDRCLVTLGDAKDIKSKRAALVSIVREWTKQL